MRAIAARSPRRPMFPRTSTNMFPSTTRSRPANTIIGFGYLPQWTWQADPVSGGGTLTLTPPSSSRPPVGYGNISGTFIPGLLQDTSDYTDLFARARIVHRRFGYTPPSGESLHWPTAIPNSQFQIPDQHPCRRQSTFWW